MRNIFIKASDILNEVVIVHAKEAIRTSRYSFIDIRNKIIKKLKMENYESSYISECKVKVTPYKLFKYDNINLLTLILLREIQQYNIKSIWKKTNGLKKYYKIINKIRNY